MVIVVVQNVNISNQTLCTQYTYTDFFCQVYLNKAGGERNLLMKSLIILEEHRVFLKLADNRKTLKISIHKSWDLILFMYQCMVTWLYF